jgi:hypothetical protein
MELITIKELGSLTPSKTNIDVVSKQIADTVINGFADPVELSVRCKFAIEVLTSALKQVQEQTIKEVGSKMNILGSDIEVIEAGVKYDYSANENWQILEMQIKPLREKQKELEKQIAVATKISKSIIDEDTGEVIASPVTRTSTTTLKITLGK